MKTLIIFLILSIPAFAFEGRVVKVVDGDTITVLTAKKQQVKVRLYGIDAPERRQAFGAKSRENLAELCAGEVAQVDVKDVDKYGRQVGVVYCQGIDAGLHQLEAGFAWAYLRYLGEEFREVYMKAEDEAKAAKKGLWYDNQPTPPWIWRKR